LALKFNTRRSAADIQRFAELAIAAIDTQLAGMDRYLVTLPADSPQYKYDAFFIEHERRLFEAEKNWIDAAVQRLPLVRVSPKEEAPAAGS
jgi:hypothetical protein